jgi:subtilisin family serine protease
MKANVLLKQMTTYMKLIALLAVSFNSGASSLSSDGLRGAYASWGIHPDQIASIALEGAWKNFKEKKDIVIAIIDTGVDYTHPLLKDSLYVKRNGQLIKATDQQYGADFSMGAPTPYLPKDDHGHGTHIAGIIKSVFPQAKLMAIKYYNAQAKEQDNLNSTIKALEYAIDQDVNIINYSSGGAGASLDELRVLKKAQEKGILVVAAAGNYGSNIDEPRNHYYPASYGLDNIMTVINHDQQLQVSSSSNFGKNSADLSAPGTRILSSLPNGRMGYLSGTSQSTAFVSGVAALIMAMHPGADFKTIKKIIISSAKRAPFLSGKCLSEGALDATSAIQVADQLINGTTDRAVANN